MNDFSSTPDYFDSREAIERIAELQSKMDDNPHCEECADFEYNIEALDEGEQEEYNELMALSEEAEGQVADWLHGEMFIREDKFTDYVEELLKDTGYLPADLPYTEVTFRGVTYLVRA